MRKPRRLWREGDWLGCSDGRDREVQYQLGVRCRHPWILRYAGPRMVSEIHRASDRGPARGASHPEVAERRYIRGWAMARSGSVRGVPGNRHPYRDPDGTPQHPAIVRRNTGVPYCALPHFSPAGLFPSHRYLRLSSLNKVSNWYAVFRIRLKVDSPNHDRHGIKRIEYFNRAFVVCYWEGRFYS
jgi:hypothetical protein